jgi:hypothetical protein
MVDIALIDLWTIELPDIDVAILDSEKRRINRTMLASTESDEIDDMLQSIPRTARMVVDSDAEDDIDVKMPLRRTTRAPKDAPEQISALNVTARDREQFMPTVDDILAISSTIGRNSPRSA